MTGPPVRRGARRGGRLRVRELRWNDFDDITRAYWRLYDERDAGEPHGITLYARKPSLPDEVEWFASFYRRMLLGDAIAVVAEVGGHVVGHCTIRRVGAAADAENGHVGELGILVERDHRGRGVGTALMREALRRARAKFRVVRLGVHSDNPGARRLYERFGFRCVGAIPEAHRRGRTVADEEIMARVLRRSDPGRPKG